MSVIIGVLIGFLVCLIIAYRSSLRKYKELLNNYFTLKRAYLKKSNQVSMIEYQYRRYKEGVNVFTVLRDMGEILYIDATGEVKNEE